MMTITIDTLRTLFVELNKQFFDNELPMPAFEFMRSKTICGQCNYTRKVIRISTFWDWNEAHLRHTMCHEMIHWWQYQNDLFGRRDRGHGYYFKKKAFEIYRKDNSLNILRCHDKVDGEMLNLKASTAKATEHRLYIFTDIYNRKCGVCVNTSNEAKIKHCATGNNLNGKFYTYTGKVSLSLPTPRGAIGGSMSYGLIPKEKWEEIQQYLIAE